MFDTHTHTHTIHSARCFVCVYWCQTPHAVIITISAEHVLEIPIVVGLDFWIHSPVGRSSPFECTTTESSTVRMSWRRWCVLVLQTVGTIYDGIIMAWNWNDFQSTSTNRLWPTVNLFICMFSVFFSLVLSCFHTAKRECCSWNYRKKKNEQNVSTSIMQWAFLPRGRPIHLYYVASISFQWILSYLFLFVTLVKRQVRTNGQNGYKRDIQFTFFLLGVRCVYRNTF